MSVKYPVPFFFLLIQFICATAFSQTITTAAGMLDFGFSGDGGPATAARMWFPDGVTTDLVGNAYFSDTYNNRIRRIDIWGNIKTVAGNGVQGYSGDGRPAMAAKLNLPGAVHMDSRGYLYFVEAGYNHIRVIDNTGIVTTLAGDTAAGYAGDGGRIQSALFDNPNGIETDLDGNIYITDCNNNRVRKINPYGFIYTIAGNGSQGYNGDGGPATNAQLNHPSSINIDHSGNIYIVDYGNNRIRKITPDGIIHAFAGNGTASYGGDGGQATNASFFEAKGIATDNEGNVYFSDMHSDRVRMVDAGNIIHDYAGCGVPGHFGDGGPATAAQIYYPVGLAIDHNNNLFIADYFNYKIRKVAPAPTTKTVSQSLPTLKIYPNPAAKEVTIDVPAGVQRGELTISDLKGGVITHVNVGSQTQCTLQLSQLGLSKGMYMVSIDVDLQHFVSPLLFN